MENSTQILTVSELTKEIRRTLEESFQQVTVVGEISNFKSHISGHWYFSLKDSSAVINCTMWKGFNQYVFFTPQDGMKIIVNGKLTVYPPRGSYQLDIRSMKPAGLGELQEAFEKLKKKLEAEGLFDEKFKKPVPVFPSKIGIVTAIDGAAFRDLVSVAKRRYPLVELVIAPARVQGSGAAESIVNSIKLLNKSGDIDVIIVGRGGGSIEDLWAFNEEVVARAIFKSRVPVISGVGHEVDFTIADYVADLRAPTPSVAMELATPDAMEIENYIKEFLLKSSRIIDEQIEEKNGDILSLLKSYGFRIPLKIVNKKSQQIDIIINRILQSIERFSLVHDKKISLLAKSMETYDIQRSLKRGFVLVKQNSKFVTRAAKFNKEKKASLKFYDGEVITR
ncbi:MAG: exodeoxyribonuclease VII large subunit [Ignavibacteriaceae bacterium]|nr:exodeoxyribonuclease VII large subunit [Ignavibacteriaceae bacterium]MCW8813576.1 exodeoxyribonuclease VII large subunit [Chlorobium sp.]MCW9098299.1 exodeoxyribonuclease VII large subunit [Ignavibacteriaceae bacterium]